MGGLASPPSDGTIFVGATMNWIIIFHYKSTHYVEASLWWEIIIQLIVAPETCLKNLKWFMYGIYSSWCTFNGQFEHWNLGWHISIKFLHEFLCVMSLTLLLSNMLCTSFPKSSPCLHWAFTLNPKIIVLRFCLHPKIPQNTVLMLWYQHL